MRATITLSALVAVATTSVVGLPSPPGHAAELAVKGAGNVTAAPWTPSLPTNSPDGRVSEVRQLVQCGSKMYAVGSFSTIVHAGSSYARKNAFSFSASAPGTPSGWRPNVNGTVNSVALSRDCSVAYLGGTFNSVNGVRVKNIAAVSTVTGAVLRGFASNADATVNTVLRVGGHLLVGGAFTTINRSGQDYMVSLNPSTGRDDGYARLNISGHYVYTDAGGRASAGNRTRVYNFALSPGGKRLLATGVFTSVGGQARRQIFMLKLRAGRAAVSRWYSPEFDRNCAVNFPFWLRDASWSPDGGRIYVATTGYKPATGPGYRIRRQRTGLCDAAAAFDSTNTAGLRHLWVNYTGCDSLYSTAAGERRVYVGGHERWASNPRGCDSYLADGATRVDAPGMVGLSAGTGAVSYNPTRARGRGARDMLLTPFGLWIASDNAFGANQCAGESEHAGICFVPKAQL